MEKFIVIDTETTNSIDDPIVYDLGFAVDLVLLGAADDKDHGDGKDDAHEDRDNDFS